MSCCCNSTGINYCIDFRFAEIFLRFYFCHRKKKIVDFLKSLLVKPQTSKRSIVSFRNHIQCCKRFKHLVKCCFAVVFLSPNNRKSHSNIRKRKSCWSINMFFHLKLIKKKKRKQMCFSVLIMPNMFYWFNFYLIFFFITLIN